MSEPAAGDQGEVLDRIENATLWITLNRPSIGNAVGPGHRAQIIELLAHANRSLAVRAVVITATGDAFCTGADLRAQLPPPALDAPPDAPARPAASTMRSVRAGAQRFIDAVLNCEKPVIAAVNGTAAGIGAHLAFACDLVLAAEEARFIEVFVRRGIVPDAGGMWLLPRLVGMQRAKELVFFGDALPARDAERLGLVNRVVPAAELPTAAREWAERLAAGPTTAIGLAKSLLNRSFESSWEVALRDEAAAVEINKGTHDAAEGITSFRERRAPEFRGW
ncbi:enoyl-CoA hydratase-related protein [Mycobacterium sp. CVI_P3]|uniref:Enoyl-CoA hydratase-related protein n=1 Tax=Mycobacterium pinniadriaticum TaxID=2994102 RepID=A0ABT3SFA1_9MYCO|nr:enoyl-CoA hydratase-related protein [Mycobacterium pinniadriaticum]MCX2931757.1 enoyl-CoA hydratase-related protein [Mycobacterium pinniadriaticum]MCX2938168.1 enoyl-CoA hydratase-related protein [Mycobacterium pinniadriaticum]